MITPKELRIGNIISLGNRVAKITEIYGLVTVVDIEETQDTIENYSRLEPIELNKDWLIKLGFKPFANDWYKDGVIIHTRKRGFVINKRTPIMKTVHQLQNYYFTNKGKELI